MEEIYDDWDRCRMQCRNGGRGRCCHEGLIVVCNTRCQRHSRRGGVASATGMVADAVADIVVSTTAGAWALQASWLCWCVSRGRLALWRCGAA